MSGRSAARMSAALLFACTLLAPARGDEFPGAAPHRHYHVRHVYEHSIHLPPERHVIEVVEGAYSTHFIINSVPFTGETACSLGWTAGQHVTLIAGDWHGYCDEAIFYNVARRQSCTMVCPRFGTRLLHRMWHGL